MKKDKEAVQAEQANRSVVSPSAPVLPETRPELPDPHTEALNERWEELQAADYEGQIALFYKTLEEDSELMDGEMVFEFLNLTRPCDGL